MMEAVAMDGGDDGARDGEDDRNSRPIPIEPFLQPPILEALFEQLSVEDLANCRLVSKLWYKESLSQWSSKVTITFNKEGIVSTRHDDFFTATTTSLEEFLDLWEEGEWAYCHFKKFYLHQWRFEAREDVEQQQRFLELVGAHATSLTFHCCHFEGRDVVRNILYQAFPMLEFLNLDRCTFHPDAPVEDNANNVLVYKEPTFGVHKKLRSLNISSLSLPDSMMDILSHFHKLTSLCLEKGVSNYGNLLEAIRLIRAQDQTKLPLTIFDVNFELELGPRNASTIELLNRQNQLNLPLQRLEIWFSRLMDYNSNNEDVIREILQDHSSTLKYLEVRGVSEAFPFGVALENLEELIFTYRFSGNLNYLRFTPKLRVLEIRETSLSKHESNMVISNSLAQLEGIGHWTLPSLTELKLYDEFHVSFHNLRKLMKWMPNLERLSGLELDDLKFWMVCKNWKNVKDLRDCGRELSDVGVLKGWNPREAAAGGGGEEDDERTQSVPSITKLKSLNSFYTRSSKLTSASVHQGFLQLPNLKRLTLGNIDEIDDEAKAALGIRRIRLNQCGSDQ